MTKWNFLKYLDFQQQTSSFERVCHVKMTHIRCYIHLICAIRGCNSLSYWTINRLKHKCNLIKDERMCWATPLYLRNLMPCCTYRIFRSQSLLGSLFTKFDWKKYASEDAKSRLMLFSELLLMIDAKILGRFWIAVITDKVYGQCTALMYILFRSYI
jgi:hypothetical protein